MRPVTVAGHDGWRITGRPHVFLYADPDQGIGEARPAADTLAWQVGGTIVRVEADGAPPGAAAGRVTSAGPD